MRLSLGDLEDRVGRVLLDAGLAADSVPFVAGAVVAAERDGARSHGLLRLPGYVNTLRTGWADGGACPRATDQSAGLVDVDAQNGFAQVALAAGRTMLLDKVRATGIAALLIRDSHHFAALWCDVEPFCEMGLVALTCANSKKRMAVWGGRERVLGTNAMAFGTPRANGPPLVWDQASSVMSQGDLLLAAAEGRPVDLGIGLDRDGRPSRSPSAILDGGSLLPFTGHKGAAIALLVEVLAAGLTGSRFAFEDRSGEVPGVTTSLGGQFVLLIDPARGGANFTDRIETLIGAICGAGAARLPGDKRYAHRRRAQADGLEVSDADLRMLADLAGERPAEINSPDRAR